MKMIFRLLMLIPILLLSNEIEKWSITVYGSAKIEVEAEQATIVYGVLEKGASLEDAYQKLKSKIETTNSHLVKLSIKEQEIFVSNFSSGDNYWGNSALFKSDNYRASTNVTITNVAVSDVERVILILGANGIDKILNISYTLKSSDNYKIQARAMALSAAKQKAIDMAKTLDSRIGKPILIEEIPIASDHSNTAVAEMLKRNPFNTTASYMMDQTSVKPSFYPQKIAIEQYVKVIFHLIQ